MGDVGKLRCFSLACLLCQESARAGGLEDKQEFVGVVRNWFSLDVQTQRKTLT